MNFLLNKRNNATEKIIYIKKVSLTNKASIFGMKVHCSNEYLPNSILTEISVGSFKNLSGFFRG